MRIKITILPIADKISRSLLNNNYPSKMNGFIYGLLNETKVHDEKSNSVKFCFSQLKGFNRNETELFNGREWGEIVKGKKTGKLIKDSNGDNVPKPYYFIISTPRADIGTRIVMNLHKYLTDDKMILNIGDFQFKIIEVKPFGTDLNEGMELISDSIVIIKDDNNHNYKELSDGFSKHFFNNINMKYKKLVPNGESHYENHLILESIKRNGIDKKIGVKFKVNSSNDQANKHELVFIGPQIKIIIKDTISDGELNKLAQVIDAGLGSHTTFGCGFVNVRVG